MRVGCSGEASEQKARSRKWCRGLLVATPSRGTANQKLCLADTHQTPKREVPTSVRLDEIGISEAAFPKLSGSEKLALVKLGSGKAASSA